MLHAARTPGEQGIHRAELYAILYLYERLSNTAIHTDSHVTLSTIQHCLDAKTFGNLYNLNDLDLIHRLWVVLVSSKLRHTARMRLRFLGSLCIIDLETNGQTTLL